MTTKLPGLGEFLRAVANTPLAQNIIAQAAKGLLNGLENDPDAVRYAEKFQAYNPGDCIICRFHEYGRKHGIAKNASPPQHDCKNRASGA